MTNENKAKGGKTLAFSFPPGLRKVMRQNCERRLPAYFVKTDIAHFPNPLVSPSLAASLSNVVCDSSAAKYVMVGQRFVTPVTECHLLVITLSLRECNARGQPQDGHYLIMAPCLNCKYYPKHNLLHAGQENYVPRLIFYFM